MTKGPAMRKQAAGDIPISVAYTRKKVRRLFAAEPFAVEGGSYSAERMLSAIWSPVRPYSRSTSQALPDWPNWSWTPIL